MGRIPSNARRIARWIGGSLAVVGLLLAANSFALTGAIAPWLAAKYSGVSVGPAGEVRITVLNLSPRAVGDKTRYTLETNEGTVVPSVLPTGFPLPPVGAVICTALYRDARNTYRADVVRSPPSGQAPSEFRAWYAGVLKTAGWTVMPAVGAAASGPLYARAGRNTARIDLPAGVWSAPATAAAAPQGGLIGDRPSDEQSGSPSQTDGWLGVYVARP